CGSSSVGRARPCQGRGREFESRFPLGPNPSLPASGEGFCFFGEHLPSRPDAARGVVGGFAGRSSATCPGGGIGRHAGLKILWPVMVVRVQVPPRVQKQSESECESEEVFALTLTLSLVV